jgi:hypothetical protein
MKVPAFLGGGLSGAQNVSAWVLAAALAYAYQANFASKPAALPAMSAEEVAAFNAKRKAETATAAAAAAATGAAPPPTPPSPAQLR